MKPPKGETPVYNEDGYSNETICYCEKCQERFDWDDLTLYAGCWLCSPCISEIENIETVRLDMERSKI